MNAVGLKLPLVLSAIVLIGATILLAFHSAGDRTQPIAFNHKKHAENNVDCHVCHRHVLESEKAGMPGISVCARCHEDVVHVSPERKKLQTYVSAQMEIPWKTVYDVPQHVLFSHKRHVVAGKLGCPECHGEVSGMSSPFTEPLTDLGMDACVDCHRTLYKNPHECLHCHR
ncbi:MAG TPA: hypothetical protein DCP63_07115 [Bacteroidetes bacterium]|nr:hypothetical protein [Bacteroidota bacterium]